ncbi:MAG: NTP transferase domain-containing protein [Bacteroidota bacterium]
MKNKILHIARELRKSQTPTEKLLWANLRNRKLEGYKFLRQHPIPFNYSGEQEQFYIADFYCAEKKLVVEVDGEYHRFNKSQDANRDAALAEMGISTLRIENEEVEDVSKVLKKIKEKFSSLPSTHPPAPALRGREGEMLRSESKVVNNLSPPSLLGREGVSELASDGGESNVGESAILILAAGSSSRLGQSKQLLQYQGQSLLQRTASIACAISQHVVVVLGSNFDNHAKEIANLSAYVVNDQDWQKGMGYSLKVGVKEILSRWPTIKAITVLVCDQPRLTEQHLKLLIECAANNAQAIACSSYGSTLGVPALFKKEMFTFLQQTGDNEGAKKLIQQHPEQVVSIPFDGGEIDIDTPEDLNKLDTGF